MENRFLIFCNTGISVFGIEEKAEGGRIVNASSFAYNRELICISYSKIVKSIDNSVITVYTVHIQLYEK